MSDKEATSLFTDKEFYLKLNAIYENYEIIESRMVDEYINEDDTSKERYEEFQKDITKLCVEKAKEIDLLQCEEKENK